ncbi:MAG TPA: site-2 protease family protein [Gemmatimonadaceae bacterium]|nr:site-2 protease family protein [Gemmatimonadaceae bacterium]
MKWSWRIGRIAGIDIDIHATFALLILYVAITEYQRSRSLASVAINIAFVLVVFASVVAHEYGHALTARRYGVATRGITLLPIGGVARLDKLPSKPQQELAIAAAGPLVSVAIALLLYVVLRVTGRPLDSADITRGGGAFLARVMWVNVAIVLFNLLPAFPMDGGRILRSALAIKLGNVRATTIAARIGKIFAVLFAIVGLNSNPFLVFIALFVWLGASGEEAQTRVQAALQDVPVERLMISEVRTLKVNDPLALAVQHLLAGFQQDFPVFEGDRVVGVLTRVNLLKALAQHGEQARVGDHMQREICVTSTRESVDRAFERLQRDECHTMPVLRDGTLVGVLTLENVGEYVMLRRALEARRTAAAT